MDMDQDPADRAWVAHTAQVWEALEWADREWADQEWADQEWVDQEWVAALGDHLHHRGEADVDAA